MSEGDIEALIERARYRGPTVTADQLVGLDACLRQLGGQIALLARPELAKRFGLELPLYHLSADEFGSDPDRIHEVFGRLGDQRAILFIDEIIRALLVISWPLRTRLSAIPSWPTCAR